MDTLIEEEVKTKRKKKTAFKTMQEIFFVFADEQQMEQASSTSSKMQLKQ